MMSLDAAGFVKDSLWWVRNLMIVFLVVILVVIIAAYQRDRADDRQGEYIRILTGKHDNF